MIEFYSDFVILYTNRIVISTKTKLNKARLLAGLYNSVKRYLKLQNLDKDKGTSFYYGELNIKVIHEYLL